jgi:hypothetical protein
MCAYENKSEDRGHGKDKSVKVMNKNMESFCS